jgi:CHASE2 domain-containing sensor protein
MENNIKRNLKEKIKYWIKTIFEFILNPRLLLCFVLAWTITNGWAYITLIIATRLKIEWLSAIAGGYLTLLWFPFTPEKVITVVISIFLLKLLFPNDKKTLQKLYDMKEKAKETGKKIKNNRKLKKKKKEK